MLRLRGVRLASDTVVQRPNFSATAARLLPKSHEDVPPGVSSKADALNRVRALIRAMEYLHVLPCSHKKIVNGSVIGGALDYIGELEQRVRDTPGLKFTKLADERIRQKEWSLQTESNHSSLSYAAALDHVLQHCRNTWTECRIEIVNAPTRGFLL